MITRPFCSAPNPQLSRHHLVSTTSTKIIFWFFLPCMNLRKLITPQITKKIWLTLWTVRTLSVIFFVGIMMIWLYQNMMNFLTYKRIGEEVNPNKFIMQEKGGKARLFKNTTWTLEQVADSLEQDERIDTVHRIYQFSIPTTLEINILGATFITDTFVFAVSENMFDTTRSWSIASWEIPVGFSSTLLDMYNLEIAQWSTFPKLSRNMAKVIPFELTFGKSTFFGTEKTKTLKYKGQVSDITAQFPTLWISIPLGQARDIQQTLQRGTFTMYELVWYTKNPKDVKMFYKKYNKQYAIKSSLQNLNDIHQKLFAVRVIFGITLGLLRIVGVIFFCFFILHRLQDNEHTIKVLQIHGATRYMVFKVIMGELWIYILWASMLTMLYIFVFTYFLTPLLQNMITTQAVIDYTIKPLALRTMVIYMFLIWVVMLWLWTIFSLPTRKRRFPKI